MLRAVCLGRTMGNKPSRMLDLSPVCNDKVDSGADHCKESEHSRLHFHKLITLNRIGKDAKFHGPVTLIQSDPYQGFHYKFSYYANMRRTYYANMRVTK